MRTNMYIYVVRQTCSPVVANCVFILCIMFHPFHARTLSQCTILIAYLPLQLLATPIVHVYICIGYRPNAP